MPAQDMLDRNIIKTTLCNVNNNTNNNDIMIIIASEEVFKLTFMEKIPLIRN